MTFINDRVRRAYARQAAAIRMKVRPLHADTPVRLGAHTTLTARVLVAPTFTQQLSAPRKRVR